MFSFWYFVPKSGLIFIFLSVINFFIWSNYKSRLDHPLLLIIISEVILFLICFFFTDLESKSKLKK